MTHTARTRIKICGITREEDLMNAVNAGVDALGFVMYAKSPRAVSVDRAQALIRLLPPFVTPVLLFVNESPEVIETALTQIPNAVLQFHGDETPEQCHRYQHPYIRAARMHPGINLLDFAHQFDRAQAILLDTHVESYGGSGKVFDWSLVPPVVPVPVVLSGGLTPANVTDGIHQVRPWAVDVSSGVEVSKGIKNPDLMRQFISTVRAADAATQSLKA